MDCGTGMENLLVESGMVMRELFEKTWLWSRL
jgi:hypothetical protein